MKSPNMIYVDLAVVIVLLLVTRMCQRKSGYADLVTTSKAQDGSLFNLPYTMECVRDRRKTPAPTASP